jgi:low affinity Fe/Cu permease
VTRWFDNAARGASSALGHPSASVLAVCSVILWAALGPAFGFSSGWQLTINTGTTIITFLMVFVVQNTQNRDTLALHAKLDALIGASEADDELQAVEELTEEEIAARRGR